MSESMPKLITYAKKKCKLMPFSSSNNKWVWYISYILVWTKLKQINVKHHVRKNNCTTSIQVRFWLALGYKYFLDALCYSDLIVINIEY